MSEWRDISTAPKDDTRVLTCVSTAFHPYFPEAAWRHSDGVWYGNDNRPLQLGPTHWMPLPARPEPAPKRRSTKRESVG